LEPTAFHGQLHNILSFCGLIVEVRLQPDHSPHDVQIIAHVRLIAQGEKKAVLKNTVAIGERIGRARAATGRQHT